MVLNGSTALTIGIWGRCMVVSIQAERSQKDPEQDSEDVRHLSRNRKEVNSITICYKCCAAGYPAKSCMTRHKCLICKKKGPDFRGIYASQKWKVNCKLVGRPTQVILCSGLFVNGWLASYVNIVAWIWHTWGIK